MLWVSIGVVMMVVFLVWNPSVLFVTENTMDRPSKRRRLYDTGGNNRGSDEDKNMRMQFINRLCDKKFAFIIAAGRSGSTTLLNMVNELPGYSLSGEHDGQFYAWYDLYKRFLTTQSIGSGRTTAKFQDFHLGGGKHLLAERNSWMHQKIHDIELFEMIQGWYYTHTGARGVNGTYSKGDNIDPTRVVRGVKEIRYDNDDLLDFISHVFPCAKFVFNTRKETFNEQAHSAFFSHTKKSDTLREQAAYYYNYSQKAHMKDRSFFMYLEDFDKLARWNEMATFLDRPECVYTDVFHDNANSSYRVHNEDDNARMVNCSK